MFSNDILSDIIVIKAVTEKNGREFEFEFQIFVERKLQVMGFQELCLRCYETLGVRHSGVARATLTSTYELKVFRMLLRWKFSNLNFESPKVYRSIWRPLAVILQYFLCIISQ